MYNNKYAVMIPIEKYLVEFAKKHQLEGVFENELRKQLLYYNCDSSYKYLHDPKLFKHFVTAILFRNDISVLVKPKLLPQINEDTPYLEFNAYYFYCLD